MLPEHNIGKIKNYVDSALNALSKSVVRHWRKPDEFCLSFEERTRIEDRIVQTSNTSSNLQRLIDKLIEANLEHESGEARQTLNSVIRRVLESFILSRGESFVQAIETGNLNLASREILESLVTSDVQKHSWPKGIKPPDHNEIARAVLNIINDPDEEIREYLRWLADSYTLLAFLRQTPDVQSTIRKMFAYGSIWLDTTVILPLIAEELLDADFRGFQLMFKGAVEAGLHFYITDGVLEETERHMHNSLTCNRMASRLWQGDVPFLYSMFIRSRRDKGALARWLELYRGDQRPEDDIAEYLQDRFNIRRRNFTEVELTRNLELRYAIQEVWQTIHEDRRRRRSTVPDVLSTLRLADHDVENYVGVVNRRHDERGEILGYNSWWLTFDKAAFTVSGELERSYGLKVVSPVMSPDFLTNYLALRPVRKNLSKETEGTLPVILDLRRLDVLPTDLIMQAEQLRQEASELPEYVIRRRVRDGLDAARSRQGEWTAGGLRFVEDEVSSSFGTRARWSPH